MPLWPWKSIGFQILLRTKYVPSLVKIHWRMLILECSQGLWTRTDGSITISPRNFVGEGIIKCSEQEARFKKYVIMSWLVKRIWMSVGKIAINTPNYKSEAAFPKFAEYWQLLKITKKHVQGLGRPRAMRKSIVAHWGLLSMRPCAPCKFWFIILLFHVSIKLKSFSILCCDFFTVITRR